MIIDTHELNPVIFKIYFLYKSFLSTTIFFGIKYKDYISQCLES